MSHFMHLSVAISVFNDLTQQYFVGLAQSHQMI